MVVFSIKRAFSSSQTSTVALEQEARMAGSPLNIPVFSTLYIPSLLPLLTHIQAFMEADDKKKSPPIESF